MASLCAARRAGDGITGEDVTDNLRTIADIPKVLHGAPETLVVRGEVYMRRSVFDAINAQRELEGQTAACQSAQCGGRLAAAAGQQCDQREKAVHFLL